MEEVTEEVAHIRISEGNQKEHFNVVFIGHVDAGKSTIGGHILFLTGMVDKRTLEKFEKESKELNRESWYLSWALDTNQEERNKGITVELGRAHFETDKRRFTILDAPGHKNYVPNMISGAAQADVAVLVISARKGEFETGFEKGGQTREHAMLAKTSGVKRLIVAVNKMDEPTVGWAQERFSEITDKLGPFLKKCGFSLKSEVEFIPISGFTGANLRDRVAPAVCPWYSGPSLLQYLDEMPSLERNLDAPLMMPITDKYKDMGTVVSGKIESGIVRRGQSLLLMPIKRTVEVVAIYDEELEIRQAGSGDNIRLKLKGVEEEEIAAGFVLCECDRPVKVAQSFEAQLAVESIRSIISIGFSAMMHVHAASEKVTLTAFLSVLDKKTQKSVPMKLPFIRSGDVVTCKLDLASPICLEAFSDYPQLGRFTLRDEGKTIARGKVLKVATVDLAAASAL